MSRKVILNVVDDYSDTDTYSSDLNNNLMESDRKNDKIETSNFREQYYLNMGCDNVIEAYRKHDKNCNINDNVDGYINVTTDSNGTCNGTYNGTCNGTCNGDARGHDSICINDNNDTSDTELDQSFLSNINKDEPVVSKPTRKYTKSIGKKPKLESKYRLKKLEFIQYNTQHKNSYDYLKNKEKFENYNKLVIPPPKPCYADNSNSGQKRVVKTIMDDIMNTLNDNERESDIIHVKNKVFKIDKSKSGKSLLDLEVHEIDLSKLKGLIDIGKVRKMIKDIMTVLSISDFGFKFNNPLYLSTSYNKTANFANSPQDIQLVNKYFCESVLRNQSLSTIIMYMYNGKLYAIYHEKTNIIVNKNYSSYKISVFSYDKGLCQESLNTLNTIIYKTNGIVLDTANGNTKIILPSTIIVKSVTQVMDFFVIWRF